jgi:capsular polysaccharide transport system ATP-binding protein
MIELRNVTKFYPLNQGVRHILRDVSLVIPGNTNLAVLGPNGAGKSTFLRLIGGAEAPNNGRILTDQSISWPLGIGTGFQPSLTGRQNVLFVCRINGLSYSQRRQVIDEVVEFAELGEYFDLPVKTYSSGMRARLSFGLSMAFQFDIYLVDELTSVGDAVFRAKAKKAFSDMRDRASLIFVSHNLQSLRESCQSALFLEGGNASFYPDIEEGINAYQDYIRSDRLAHAKELQALKKAKRIQRRQRRIRRRQRAKISDPKSEGPDSHA